VAAVGDDARLRAGQRDRLEAEVVDDHRGEGAGDSLARGEQHVHLARMRTLGNLVGERDQLVRVLPARGEHNHDVIALPSTLDDPPGGTLDALGIGYRGPPELHDDRVRHDAER
jgi:hypothetical protein